MERKEKVPIITKNFSRIQDLESFRGVDGKLELKLVWPDADTAPQHWKQTSNPYLKRSLGVEGYEAVAVIHEERGWGGLQYDGERACFNGSVHASGDWCYAIGAWVQGMSGPKGLVKEVELYARKSSNEEWELVMRQVIEHLLWCPPKVALVKNSTDPNNNNYSILNELENYRFEGTFELKLSWPKNAELQSQQWKQSSNPYLIQERGVVLGYEPISCPHSANLWGGLQYDEDTCVLSGSSKADVRDLSFYAIGSYVDYQGGIAGPEGVVQQVELHVKNANTNKWVLIMRQTTPTFNNGSNSNKPIWDTEAEFTATPPRGVKSGGDAQSAGKNNITNAKGFKIQPDDEVLAKKFIRRGCGLTLLLVLFSPFVVLSTLFNRLGVSENIEGVVRCFFKIVTFFLFVWPFVLVFGFGNTEITKYAIGAWVVLLLLCLFPWPELVVADMEWNTIDDFASHRVWRWTFENCLAVASLFLAILQLVALSWRLVPLKKDTTPLFDFDISAYLEFKTWLSDIFSVFNFDFDVNFDFLDWPRTKFWLAVFFTFVWLFVFVGVGTSISLLLKRFNRGGKETGYGGDSKKNERQKSNKIIWLLECLFCCLPIQKIADFLLPAQVKGLNDMSSLTRVRLSMYFVLSRNKVYRIVFSLLSEILYIPIVSAFLSTIDCTEVFSFSQSNLAIYSLDIQPERMCWVGAHRIEAMIALVLLPVYVFTTMILAPLALADSDGLFVASDLDVRYAALFLLSDRFGRFCVLLATIFLSRWPWFALAVNICVNCWLAFVTERNKPCSMPWVNVILAVTFGASAFCSACLLLDLTGIPWIPMGLLIGGWLILLVVGIVRVVIIARAGYPFFRLVDAKGAFFHDTETFDDTSLMRGFKHRIHSVTTFLQGNDLKGFQIKYKVDYLTVAGPRHLGLQSVAGEKIVSSTMKLDADEGIKFVMVECGGCTTFRGINKIEFHTTKGRIHEAGESTASGEKLAIKPPGNVPIMGFHGGTGGHIHNLGLIIENTY